MAFPSVGNTAQTLGTTATTTPVVNLPANILPGHLLIVLVRVAVAGTITFPAGWTALASSNTADASDDETAIYYRLADGTEGSTITLGSGNGKFAAISYRITGAENTGFIPCERNSPVTGTSTTPDPGNLAPSAGAKDYLWLWLGGWEGEQTSPPASQPTGYSNPIGADSGTAGLVTTNCRVAGAEKQANAASEDPGSWTISVSDDWTAWTVAVHPVSIPFIVEPPYVPE